MKHVTLLLALAVVLGLCAGCAGKTADIDLFDTVCTADEALSAAKEARVVVIEGLQCTSGKDVWDAFYKTVSAGKQAKVLCARYYTLNPDGMSAELYEQEKDQYPRLFFCLLQYDGKTYTVTVRKSDEAEPEHQDTFPYLLHLTGDAPPTGIYATYDNYVLLDDPTATWEGIEAGIFSSQFGAGYRHYTVYSDYR